MHVHHRRDVFKSLCICILISAVKISALTQVIHFSSLTAAAVVIEKRKTIAFKIHLYLI